MDKTINTHKKISIIHTSRRDRLLQPKKRQRHECFSHNKKRFRNHRDKKSKRNKKRKYRQPREHNSP